MRSVPDRADDRLAAAEIIDALANDFDRLVEHVLRHRPFSPGDQPNEERSAALNIETERDLLLRRLNRQRG